MAGGSLVEEPQRRVDVGVVPVFYNKDPEVAIAVTEACMEGGARCVEFTNRGDLAYKVFAEAVEHVLDKDLDVIMGVGSVVDAPTAGIYIASGANFVIDGGFTVS